MTQIKELSNRHLQAEEGDLEGKGWHRRKTVTEEPMPRKLASDGMKFQKMGHDGICPPCCQSKEGGQDREGTPRHPTPYFHKEEGG